MSTEDTTPAAVPDEPVMDIGFLSLPAGVQQAAEAMAAEQRAARERRESHGAIPSPDDPSRVPATAPEKAQQRTSPAPEQVRVMLEAAAPLIAAAGRERIVRWLERRAGQQVPGVARDALLEAAEALEDRSDEERPGHG